MHVYIATTTTYWVLEAESPEEAKAEFERRLADPEDDFFLAGEVFTYSHGPEDDEEVVTVREATPAEVAHFWQPNLHPL